ncbi:MAG: hypothetical protein LC799_02900 [Actinobacteria bacterium]|nr:hypothetical protein [Actinomycetota bacterium]
MPKHKYVMVSPAGNEHPTDDEVYRTRLLTLGYSEKPQDDDAAQEQGSAGQEPAREVPPAEGSGEQDSRPPMPATATAKSVR